MKVWMPILAASFCVTLLSVLAGMKEKYRQIEMIIEECRGEANVQQCAKKCSKTFKCVDMNHTCCWTHCGNICWENEKSMKENLNPNLPRRHQSVLTDG